MYARIGDRQAALKLITDALKKPATKGESTLGVATGHVRRCRIFGHALIVWGFPLQGFHVLERSLEADVKGLSMLVGLQREQRNLIVSGRQNVQGFAVNDQARKLAEENLIRDLKSRPSSELLARCVARLDRVPGPANITLNPKYSITPFVSVLQFVQSEERLPGLLKQLAELQNKSPNDEGLKKLNLLVNAFAGDTSVLPELTALKESVEDADTVKRNFARTVIEVALQQPNLAHAARLAALNMVIIEPPTSIKDGGRLSIAQIYFDQLTEIQEHDKTSISVQESKAIVDAFAKTNIRNFELRTKLSNPSIVGQSTADQLRQKKPDDIDSLLRASLTAAESNKRDQRSLRERIKSWGYLIGHYPKHAEHPHSRATLHQLLGQDEEAIRDYTLAIKNGNKQAAVYFRRGSLYRNHKNNKAAKADFEKVVQLGVDENHTVWELLATIALEEGEYDVAVKYLTKITSSKATNYKAYYLLALTMLDKGDLDAYRKYCDQMWQIVSRNNLPTASSWTARTYIASPDSTKDWRKVVSQATLAANQSSGNYFFQNNLAAAYYRAGQYANALTKFKRANSINSRSPWSWIFLALTHKKLGNDAEAQKWHTKFMSWWAKRDKPKLLNAETDPVGHLLWNYRVHYKQLVKEADELFAAPAK